MGQRFRHIADSALEPCEGTVCHHCERDDRPIFEYSGRIVDPKLAADPALAEEEPEVSELCADCILGGNVVRDMDDRLRALVDKLSDSRRLWREFQQLPEIPLFLQGFDWPLCCGDWCELVGCADNHRSLVERHEQSRAWDRGPTSYRRDFRSDGAPESLREISFFRCHHCRRETHIDQFT